MNMKKIIRAATLMAAYASAGATTYAVWPQATEGQEQIPNRLVDWWNFKAEEVIDAGISVQKCSMNNKGLDAASAGWLSDEGHSFDLAQIAPKDLVLEAKIEGPGKWNVRLTSGVGNESDVTIEIPADGKYHLVRYNVQKGWPVVYEKWLAGQSNGKALYTFSLVGSALTAESAIYFTNCRYEDAIPMPSVEPTVTDITHESATINFGVTFPEGYTDTKIAVDGSSVLKDQPYYMKALQPNTEYTRRVSASGYYEGVKYTVEKAVTFKTLREPGKNPVWYGNTDIPGFTADYSIIYNDDKTLTVEAEFVTEKETPAADRNFHIFVGGDEWLKLKDDGTGHHSGTTSKTYEDGTSITWEWYLPYAGGVYQQANTYVVGSENEAPLSIRIKANAQNVTFNSAEIAYEVTCPTDNYEVYYLVAGGEAVKADANPIVISGLAERTEYTYEVYAVMADGTESVESRHATVTFKTTVENAVDYVYSDLFKAEFKNAIFEGEDESMRRTLYVTLPWSVVYKADATATYAIDLKAVKGVVGLNPQIWWNGFQQLTLNAATGLYEYNFGPQDLEAETAISHYFAYNGGAVDVRTPYTNWGMEKEAPQLGATAGLTLSASKNAVLVGEKVILSPVATDEAGYYLPADAVEYVVDGGDYELDGNSVRFTNAKGMRTVTAVSGDFEAAVEINVMASAEANNLASGLVGSTDADYIQAGSVENVTDSDRNSQLEWKCNETQEHYFILDLANGDDNSEGFYIEAIDVYFEGAYATKFTVTLSSQAPAELAANGTATYAASAEDKVFENTKNDTQHYFTQDPEAQHRYVALRTSEALDTGWGIKLRDLKVYGSEAKPSSTTTGVENVVVEDSADAAVEYYNLSGLRVAEPSTGIYIRRQGNKASKVLIK